MVWTERLTSVWQVTQRPDCHARSRRNDDRRPRFRSSPAAREERQRDRSLGVRRVEDPEVGRPAGAIRAIGPAHCILSSDLGQAANPIHTEGLTAFFAGLRQQGFTQAEIDLMSKTNPARALGLN